MWIETISVRTARAEQCAMLLREMSDFRNREFNPVPEWFVCYENLEVENEISIHMAWEEKLLKQGKTNCGLLISRRFAQFGIVHHTLWNQALIFKP
ncbi:MAG: hypothetical protein R6U68_05070 [Desulfobacteraceae bacterium]